MWTGLRRILFPRFVRRPIRRAARRPFGRLVAHFLARLVRGGQEGESEEFELTLGPLLGLLAAPGAISCFLLLAKYSSLLNWLRGRHNVDIFVTSLPEKYRYISIAMAVCGIITVLKWDKLLPDSQDYLNLAPLPIGARTIFLANAAAILIAVAVIAIDVNAIPSVLFPMFVAASGHLHGVQSLQFVGVHLLCAGLASVFAIFAVFALLGTMAVVLPRAAFRACSPVARGILLLAFFVLLLTGFAGPQFVARLQRFPGSALEWLPSLWYLGLYQSLQDRAIPALARTVPWVWGGAGAALALTAVSYAISYRRRFAGVLESGRKGSARFAVGLAVLDLFGGRAAGFERGCHRFTVRALLRNETHRMTIAVSVGMGWLLSAQVADPLRQGPLLAAYLLLLGLRVAFDLPAAAPANWVFRTILDEKENQAPAVARRVMLSFLTPLVLAPALASAWWQWGLGPAALHTFYV